MEHFYQKIVGYCSFIEFYKWIASQLPMDRESRCVEVGVHSGQSAACLAVEIHNREIPSKLDLIDFFTNGNIANRPAILEQINKTFEPVKHVIDKIIASDSAEAASLYEDNSIDFIFIDASHEYPDVKKDIIAWKPKMKSGAIMSGHDFCYYPGTDGVFQAVMEEFTEWNVFRGTKFYGNDERERNIIGSDGKYFPCWWVRIP